MECFQKCLLMQIRLFIICTLIKNLQKSHAKPCKRYTEFLNREVLFDYGLEIVKWSMKVNEKVAENMGLGGLKAYIAA